MCCRVLVLPKDFPIGGVPAHKLVGIVGAQQGDTLGGIAIRVCAVGFGLCKNRNKQYKQ